jgi:ketosteroid isomerase-like protein
MKLKKHFLAFILFAFSLNLFSQHKLLPKQEVEEIMKKQEKAWNNFDIDGFMLYYWNSDSLMFIGSKGITYGWKQTLENYKKNYSSKELMGELTFTNISYETLSTTALHVVGKWQIKRKDSQIGGYYSLLWKKINDKWVIVRDHTS